MYLRNKLKKIVYLESPGFEERSEKGTMYKLKRKLKEELLKNNFKAVGLKNCIFTNYNETCFFVFSSYNFTTIDNDSQIYKKIIKSL